MRVTTLLHVCVAFCVALSVQPSPRRRRRRTAPRRRSTSRAGAAIATRSSRDREKQHIPESGHRHSIQPRSRKAAHSRKRPPRPISRLPGLGDDCWRCTRTRYPVVVNHETETAHVVRVAGKELGRGFLLAPSLSFILKTLVFVETVCRRMALLLRRRL